MPLCRGKYSIIAALSFRRGSNVQLYQVMVNNTKHFGLHTSNVFGSILISESAFLRSNARLWFGYECELQCSNTVTHLYITSSQFLNGHTNGLEVTADCPGVYALIDNTTIRNNSGDQGGNVALSVTDLGVSTQNQNQKQPYRKRKSQKRRWTEILDSH